MEGKFTAVYEKIGKWYVGYVEELPGANTQGHTLDETRENLREAVQLILDEQRTLHRGRINRKENEPMAAKPTRAQLEQEMFNMLTVDLAKLTPARRTEWLKTTKKKLAKEPLRTSPKSQGSAGTSRTRPLAQDRVSA